MPHRFAIPPWRPWSLAPEPPQPKRGLRRGGRLYHALDMTQPDELDSEGVGVLFSLSSGTGDRVCVQGKNWKEY
ncbi:MAG: hypothetical protein WBH85_09690 [Thermoanaerobaculia bacterium]